MVETEFSEAALDISSMNPPQERNWDLEIDCCKAFEKIDSFHWKTCSLCSWNLFLRILIYMSNACLLACQDQIRDSDNKSFLDHYMFHDLAARERNHI